MKVFISAPHQLLREALISLVTPQHEHVDEAEAEVAICNLCPYVATGLYPPPPTPPALALVCGSDTEAAGVLRLGYRGVFRTEEGSQTLDHALQALVRGENWAERHVLAAALEAPKSPWPNLPKESATPTASP